MLVDGNTIAADILLHVAEATSLLRRPPVLMAVTCAPNFETKKYLHMKQRQAVAAGIRLEIVELPADSTSDSVVAAVSEAALGVDGVVVQLPLPSHIDVQAVLDAIPNEKDPDGFRFGVVSGACLPPVVGAIAEISARHNVLWEDARVVVLGEGRLVGGPAATYARQRGAQVTVLTKDTFDSSVVRSADIIVSGIGQPRCITAAMVADGAVVFDAGTSEDGGVLVGDMDASVASKAKLLTPVPGGIGPITIACLLRNLVILARQ